MLNRQFDPTQQRFRIAERFNITPKPGITHPTKLEELTAVLETNGPFALFEFTGALPRAALYPARQVITNDQATLDMLASPSFDPAKKVLVANEIPGAPTATGGNESPGEVKFTSYAPKDIVLSANATTGSVLLLNDRFDPNWKVFVDGRPETLLRCNYIMRGVYLSAGMHKVEFQFMQPMRSFYVSLSAVILWVLLALGLPLIPGPPPPRPANEAAQPARKSSATAR